MVYPRIRLTQNLDHDLSWGGPTAIMTAGENLAFGDAVYIKDDGKVWKAKADALATMPCVALATGTINADDPGEFLLFQFLRNNAWSWTLGGLLYISETIAGALTQTKPTGTDVQVQVVGKVIASNIIYFSSEAILAGGGGDMFKSVYDPDADGVVKDSDKLEGSTKAQVRDHTPKAHTLGSHSTKAHSELTGVSANQHHAQAHTLASHSSKAHSELTGVGPSDHHTPYSHPGTPQCSGCPHPSGRYAHPGSPQCVGCPHASGRYTDAEAQTTVKANVEVGDLKTPTKNLPMNSKKITGLAAPGAANDAVRADANLRAPDSSKLEGSSKATVQNHTPKAHTLASHSTKAHTELTGVSANQHHAQAHTLASHSSKAHSELTGVTANQHHTKVAITNGSYVGNSANNRAIAHGLGVIPKMVFIYDDRCHWFRIQAGLTKVLHMAGGSGHSSAVTAMNSTNFYVGSGDPTYSANENTYTYYWVAIG